MTGNKKLANGMTAAIQLEMGIEINQGTNSQAGSGTSNSTVFGRQANFSLEGDYGKVGVSLQINPAFGPYAATDPRGVANNNSGLAPWIVSSASTLASNVPPAAGSNNSNSTASIFLYNDIQYSKQIGGMTATLAYSPNSPSTGNNSKNTITAVGLVYGQGPLLVSAGAMNMAKASPTAQDASESNFGVACVIGSWRLAANYLDFKAGGGTGEFQTTGAGVTYSVTDPLKLNAAYYSTKDAVNGGKLNTATIGMTYALDKSVTLYAQVGASTTDATGFGAAGSSTTNWTLDAGSTGSFMASPGNTVQTTYLGARVAF